MLALYLSLFVLVSQDEISGDQPQFQDPFADQAPAPVPEEPPSLGTQPESELPTFNAPQNTESPPQLVAPEPDSMTNPQVDSLTPPPSPDIPSSPISNPKPFEFPSPGPVEGPIAQEVIEREIRDHSVPEGTWSLAVFGGAAVNMNKALNQVDTSLALGYRFDQNWEAGLLPYFRFVRAKLIGALGTISYFWHLKGGPDYRIELATGAGLGWAIRSKDHGFNEGRMPLRLISDLHFYASTDFAIIASLGVESHPFGAQKGKMKSFLSGGPPTQLLTNLGLRLNF